MSRPVTEVLLHHITRLARHEADAGKSDGELLRRFCATGDGEVFTLLVQRHGALVWRVCTAALPCRQDAEDVFQATFLVLARKAASIRKPSALTCWLHGVADRLRKVRSQNVRRAQTGATFDHVPARPLDDWTWREVRQVVHEELRRLPEKLRLPILLCHLEDMTQEEAAQSLGWTTGQLRGRLLRGRALLHRRLSRRGLAPAVPLFPALLFSSDVFAALPLPLIAAVRAGIAGFAKGSATPSATTVPLRLAQQFTRQATITRSWLAVCCALVVLFSGVLGVLALQPAAPTSAETQPPAAVLPALAGFDAPEQPGATQEKQPLLKDLLGDALPADAVLRLGTIRFRHEGVTNLLVFGAGGKELIAGGWNRTIRRWDPDSGTDLPPLTGPEKGFDTMTATSDGKTLIGGKAGTIQVWDLVTAKKIKSFSIPGIEYFRQLAVTDDGRTLAVTGQDKAVRLWDCTTVKELRTLHKYAQETSCLAFSPNGKLLASAAYDKTARIHDVATGKEVLLLKPKTESFRSLCFSPDGKALWTGEEKAVCAWDVKTGKLLHRWDGLKGNSYVIRFAPGGQQVAAGTSAGIVYLWDRATGKKLHEIHGHADNVQALAFSPDGKKLASAGSESAVRVWDTKTGKQLNPLLGHQERVTAVAVAPDGQTVATSAWDLTIRLWDAHTGKEVRRLTWPPAKDQSDTMPSMNRDVAFSPDGKWLAAAGPENKVWLWDLAKDNSPVRSFSGSFVAFAPDGKHLAVAGWSTNVALYELASGKEIRQFKGHLSGVARVRFTPDGKSLVTVSQGEPIGFRIPGEVWDKKTIWVWDLATGKARLKFGGGRASGLAISPDGRMLAENGFLVKSVTLWELATGQERARLEPGHPEGISGVAFSPNGKLLATTSYDHTSCLWQLPSGKKLHCFEGHLSWALCVAFFPDSAKVLTGSQDTTGLIWKVPAPPVTAAPPPLPAEKLTRLWDDLAGDAWDAYRATNSLVTAPNQAVALLAQKVKPAAVPDAALVAKLIADLDSKTFAVRQQALQKLEKMGELVTPHLEKALTQPPSVEAALRLQKILDAIGGQVPGPETIRGLRAIEILEHIATPPARSLLQTLSHGAPGAALTREAKASLKRLEK